MTKGPTLESLLSFSIKDLRTMLRRDGYRLSSLEKILRTPGSSCGGTINWRQTNQISGESWIHSSAKISLFWDTDKSSLCLEFRYHVARYGRTDPEERVSRFLLEKRPSNLLPETSRYYFRDPWGTPGSICGKVYIWEGGIVTRSFLSKLGYLYEQQREGHSDRYIWSFYERVPKDEDLKYRKSHYRGRITPFWKRYEYLREEGEYRVCLGLVGSGLIPPEDLEEDL